MTAAAIVYLLSYVVVRSLSYSSASRTPPGMAPTIIIGVREEALLSVAVVRDGKVSAEDAADVEPLYDRAARLNVIYAPLIWVDKRLTGCQFWSRK